MNNQQVENNNLTNEINDLEPQETEKIKGGQTREHVLLAKQASVPNSGRCADDVIVDGKIITAENYNSAR